MFCGSSRGEGGRAKRVRSSSTRGGGKREERTDDFQNAQELLILRLGEVNRHLVGDSSVVDYRIETDERESAGVGGGKGGKAQAHLAR